MKELTIEEKAERYDKALVWMQNLYPTLEDSMKEDAEHYFLELKESDADRIRKYILSCCEETIKANDRGLELSMETTIKLRDWLEKQGEQKLNVNDNAKEMFIKALERVEEQNNKGYKLTDCDKNSWWEDFKAYTTSKQILANSTKTCDDEQKSIKWSGKIGSKCAQGKLKEMLDSKEKPAWSVDDEDIALGIEQIVNCASLLNIAPDKLDKVRNWLKSLKDRYTWKPSDEQMKFLHKYAEQNNYAGTILTSLYNDLKQL